MTTMVKFLFITLLSTKILCVSIMAFDNCPQSENESSPCANEEAHLLSVTGQPVLNSRGNHNEDFENFEFDRQFNYCLRDKPVVSNGTQVDLSIEVGIQCRTLKLYRDTRTGEISKEMFKHQMVFIEGHRTYVADSYWVRNADGTYNSYHDEAFDGVVQINYQEKEWNNVKVDFENTSDGVFFPAFTAETVEASTGKVIGASRWTFTEDNMSIINNYLKSEDKHIILNYFKFGTSQSRK